MVSTGWFDVSVLCSDISLSLVNEMRPGSELLVEALQNEDVDFIFGYPGGAVLPLYDTF
jgi:hypothetical protein